MLTLISLIDSQLVFELLDDLVLLGQLLVQILFQSEDMGLMDGFELLLLFLLTLVIVPLPFASQLSELLFELGHFFLLSACLLEQLLNDVVLDCI